MHKIPLQDLSISKALKEMGKYLQALIKKTEYSKYGNRKNKNQ